MVLSSFSINGTGGYNVLIGIDPSRLLSDNCLSREHETMSMQQNISKYFTTASAETSSTSSSKRKSANEGDSNETDTSKKNRKYDRDKRKRTFIATWNERFPWARSVVEDEKPESMYCEYCQSFPEYANKKSALYVGTSNIRIDPLVSHDKTNEHVFCARKYLTAHTTTDKNELVYRKKVTPVEKHIFKALVKLSDKEKNKMRYLFNTAYAVAKKGKPFSDFIFMMEVQKMNGFIDFENYQNIASCTMFIESIAQVLRIGIKADMKKVNFISVMADGSTDSAVIEQEIIYIRYAMLTVNKHY